MVVYAFYLVLTLSNVPSFKDAPAFSVFFNGVPISPTLPSGEEVSSNVSLSLSDPTSSSMVPAHLAASGDLWISL